ncbi:hypothetical protein SLS60_007933 [Paraconiothyrium brasiliense]|uniref:Uncharacterized protein n=1 Tax=Paraconiothyrium brasiliense TaxID=300254 RepID=A0ABR3R2Y5_9PLEO
MPLFPVSPERTAGTKPPYGPPPAQSPSLPDLRTSPLRKHRRNDSDVSVQGLAAMFENLEVKDFKEAQAKYMVALQKEKTKHAAEITKLERKYQMMERYRVRVDELEHELKRKAQEHDSCIARETYEKCRKDNRDAIAKWENAFKHVEEQREQMNAKIAKLSRNNEVAMAKGHVYKKAMQDAKDEAAHVKPQVAILKGKNEGLEKTLARIESDLKFYMKEAEKYKNECYTLDMRVNVIEAHLGEEIHTLKHKLSLVEGERDALKTSLKEEEVLRIAAEGQIPLPSATTDEHDEFGSPVRSLRQQRSFAGDEGDGEDKENVAPKKAAIELKLARQELAMEKRLRERAQEQIDFMKMECQFRCCSCRIADSKGSDYVHDNSYAAAIDAIKASFPALTPPPSDHGDEHMEDVIKSEPMAAERPTTPPAEEVQRDDDSAKCTEQSLETVIVKRPSSTTPEPAVAFSPTTGTFRSIASSEKIYDSTQIVPSEKPRLESSTITGLASPWVPNARRPQSRANIQTEQKRAKSGGILIHEDAVMDSDEDDEEGNEPESPSQEVSDPPVTPYLTRTITTTTTIPLHFSPVTPAIKSGDEPLTPSTIAHAPTNAPTPVLGELNLNKLPIDREAALEAIRQRRGRARSMAMGQETPRKQMMEGVKERRDISAPVSRVRR